MSATTDSMPAVTLCYSCNVRPVRALPNPVPEGWPVSWLESAAIGSVDGPRSIYCTACFDRLDEADPDGD